MSTKPHGCLQSRSKQNHVLASIASVHVLAIFPELHVGQPLKYQSLNIEKVGLHIELLLFSKIDEAGLGAVCYLVPHQWSTQLGVIIPRGSALFQVL